MDDIQFWIYLIFAAIYFLTRNLRKRSKQSEQKRPRSPLETEEINERRPTSSTSGKRTSSGSETQSFEDLLREITGQSEFPGQKKEEVEEVEEPEPFVEAFDQYDTAGKREYQEKKENIEEGKTRRFSDEESRRVYEESVKLAEGSALDFNADDDFRSSKLKTTSGYQEPENEFVKEIRRTLQSAEGTKKAVVLSEILNRKY